MFHVTAQYMRWPATGAGDHVTVSVGDVNADELTYWTGATDGVGVGEGVDVLAGTWTPADPMLGAPGTTTCEFPAPLTTKNAAHKAKATQSAFMPQYNS